MELLNAQHDTSVTKISWHIRFYMEYLLRMQRLVDRHAVRRIDGIMKKILTNLADR